MLPAHPDPRGLDGSAGSPVKYTRMLDMELMSSSFYIAKNTKREV